MGYNPKIRPHGSTKIGTGIYLQWNYGTHNKDLFINAKMQVFGSAATQDIAEQMKKGIESYWTKSFPSGHSIKTGVDMCYRKDNVQEASRIQIIVTNESGPSIASHERTRDTDSICVRFHINDEYDTNKIPGRMAHEFGHLISLGDEYEDLNKGKNEPRHIKVKLGWENNIMANIDGIVESRNIEEIFIQNCREYDDDDF